VNANDPLTEAIAEWQRKQHIADGDRMIAVLELVRIYLLHSPKTDDGPDAPRPGFEDFRGTIELLDRRSKAFVQQATDLIGELRRFGQNVKRINRERLITLCVVIGLGALVGMLIDRLL
jgi:hypothetical protein